MTEPVQVDTATQYSYKHTQQEQGNGYILNVHRQTSFLSKIKNAPIIGRKFTLCFQIDNQDIVSYKMLNIAEKEESP